MFLYSEKISRASTTEADCSAETGEVDDKAKYTFVTDIPDDMHFAYATPEGKFVNSLSFVVISPAQIYKQSCGIINGYQYFNEILSFIDWLRKKVS